MYGTFKCSLNLDRVGVARAQQESGACFEDATTRQSPGTNILTK